MNKRRTLPMPVLAAADDDKGDRQPYDHEGGKRRVEGRARVALSRCEGLSGRKVGVV